jgi:hypothetical protein
VVAEGMNSGEAYFDSSNVGWRKCSSVLVRPGTRTSPPRSDNAASTDIAAFIGQARSAIACSEPGKPTSVSSGSPVDGLCGSS